jgi:hypothetical protein
MFQVAYPPYDLLILITVTFLFGLLLKKTLFKRYNFSRGIDQLFPYAFVYIPASLIFSFIVDELPLKFYGATSISNDLNGANELGPQSPNMEGMVNAGIYLLSLGFNFIVWVICLVIIIRGMIGRKKQIKRKFLLS